MLLSWIKLTLFPKEDQQLWIVLLVTESCKNLISVLKKQEKKKESCLIQPPEEQIVLEQNVKETFLLNHVSTIPSIPKEERKSSRGTKPAHLTHWLPQLWTQGKRSKVSASCSPSVLGWETQWSHDSLFIHSTSNKNAWLHLCVYSFTHLAI